MRRRSRKDHSLEQLAAVLLHVSIEEVTGSRQPVEAGASACASSSGRRFTGCEVNCFGAATPHGHKFFARNSFKILSRIGSDLEDCRGVLWRTTLPRTLAVPRESSSCVRRRRIRACWGYVLRISVGTPSSQVLSYRFGLLFHDSSNFWAAAPSGIGCSRRRIWIALRAAHREVRAASRPPCGMAASRVEGDPAPRRTGVRTLHGGAPGTGRVTGGRPRPVVDREGDARRDGAEEDANRATLNLLPPAKMPPRGRR